VATRDPVGVALASIAAGACTGAATITLAVLALRTLIPGGAVTDSAGGPPPEAGALLQGAGFLGIAIAAGCGWLLCRPLADPFQRGVAAAVAVFGALLLAVLAVPADAVGRATGLAVYLLVLVAAGSYAATRARRAAAA
jgi:hypothetical protein